MRTEGGVNTLIRLVERGLFIVHYVHIHPSRIPFPLSWLNRYTMAIYVHSSKSADCLRVVRNIGEND